MGARYVLVPEYLLFQLCAGHCSLAVFFVPVIEDKRVHLVRYVAFYLILSTEKPFLRCWMQNAFLADKLLCPLRSALLSHLADKIFLV